MTSHNVIFSNSLVDGYFADWSNWTECTVSCGGGYITRDRDCIGPYHRGLNCSGDWSQTLDCNTHECPSELNKITRCLNTLCVASRSLIWISVEENYINLSSRCCGSFWIDEKQTAACPCAVTYFKISYWVSLKDYTKIKLNLKPYLLCPIEECAEYHYKQNLRM